MTSLVIIAVLLIMRLVVVPLLLRLYVAADSTSAPDHSTSVPDQTSAPDHEDPCLGPMIAPSVRPPAGSGDTLYVDLVSGRISREQYRSAMAALAARDAVRHPLVVPSQR